MFLKRHVRRKDGEEHVYYSLCESIRLSRNRTIQRRVLNLGELNTTQIERWQRSIEVIEQKGETRQYRLFTDREGAAPAEAPDVCEVVLSSYRCVGYESSVLLAGQPAAAGTVIKRVYGVIIRPG